MTTTPAETLPEARFVGVPQAQVVLGLSRTSVYALMNTGELRWARVNGRRLIPVQELDRFTDSLLAQAQ
jgi:excisionase family DNA binding protein